MWPLLVLTKRFYHQLKVCVVLLLTLEILYWMVATLVAKSGLSARMLRLACCIFWDISKDKSGQSFCPSVLILISFHSQDFAMHFISPRAHFWAADPDGTPGAAGGIGPGAGLGKTSRSWLESGNLAADSSHSSWLRNTWALHWCTAGGGLCVKNPDLSVSDSKLAHQVLPVSSSFRSPEVQSLRPPRQRQSRCCHQRGHWTWRPWQSEI